HLRTLTGHNGEIYAVCALTLDGTTLLATASADGTVRIWDPTTGAHLRTLTGHDGEVWSVCPVTDDGTTLLATTGSDETARIWDPTTGAHLPPPPAPTAHV